MKKRRGKDKRGAKRILKLISFALIFIAVIFWVNPRLAGAYTTNGSTMGGSISSGNSASALVSALCGPGTQTKNARVTSVSSNQYGIGTDLYVNKSGVHAGVCGSTEFTSGVIMTTGSMNNVLATGSTSNGGSASTDSQVTSLLPNQYSKAYDYVVLEFDMYTGSQGYAGFEYVYLTAEMNYHGTSFVDPFALLVNGSQADRYSNQSKVNVDNQYAQRLNSTDTYFYNNGSTMSGTKYNGISTVLKVGKYVTPNTWAHIKIILSDAGDHVMDSTVILRGNSLSDDVNYSADTYTVTLDQNGHGSSVGNFNNVKKGATVSLPGNSDPDYAFTGWNTNRDGSGSNYISNYSVNGSTTLYANWKAKEYTATVVLNKNDESWTGQKVSLYQNGMKLYDLTENNGTYSNRNIVVNGKSKEFSIYVNGKDTGKKITIYRNNESAMVDFFDANITTTVDGQPDGRPGNVVLSIDAFLAGSDDNQTGIVTIPVVVGEYKVYVDGIDTGYRVSNNQNSSVEIPYYDIAVDLTYDTPWNDAKVTLRQDGYVKETLTYVSTVNNTATYHLIMQGDFSEPVKNRYQLYVNGDDVEKNIELTQSGTTKEQVAYYKVVVDAYKDGNPYDDLNLNLKNNGSTKYILKADGTTTGRYVCDYVLGREGNYEIANGNTATGINVSQNTASREMNYYTVTYMKNETVVHSTQIVLSGNSAPKKIGPVSNGMTFIGWFKDAASVDSFDFSEKITQTTIIYAGYAVPIVRINSYKPCQATISELTFTNRMDGTGAYYMPEFAITGFPAGNTSKAIKFAIIEITNGTVYTKNQDGVIVNYNHTQSGTGTVKITFTDGVSAKQAEDYFRENVVFKPISTANGTINVKINGNTLE